MMILHNKKPAFYFVDGLRLAPGANVLTEEQEKVWLKARDSEPVAGRIARGELVEEVKAEKPVERRDHALVGLETPDAGKLIAETYDLALLADWRKIETDNDARADVLAAIDEQTKRINDTDKDDKNKGKNKGGKKK